MNFETFNLNDHVRVKLNDLGFVTWKQEFEKYLPERYHKPLSDFVARADDEGYVDFQAWNFIKLFGEHVYMAGPSLFDLAILIQRPEPTPPPTPRPLSSLTEEEARECYRLAFYYWDGLDALTVKVSTLYVEVESPFLKLVITQPGVMVASKQSQNACTHARFNAVRVVRYLDSLGIALGQE